MPPSSPSAAEPPAPDATRAAGRGGVAVLGAKVFFILAGLVQQTLLPRAIGLAGFGAFSRVMAVATVLNNVVVGSSIQSVSRAVAASPGRERTALSASFAVHGPVALALGAGVAALAPAVAAFQRAPHIRQPLALLGLVTFLYGLYAPLVGALNGQKLFARQAALDVTTAFLRTVTVVGVGAFAVARGLYGPSGAAVGAGVAAALVLPLAVHWAVFRGAVAVPSAAGPAPGAPSPSAYAMVLVPLAGAQLFTNVLMQMDISLLGRFLADGAPSADVADEWVAVYRACQLFAFLPYQLLMSVTQVLFPMVARAFAADDGAAVRRFVERGGRLGVLAAGLLVGVVAALPSSCLALAFVRTVADRGASTLRVLVVGQGAFALLGIATAVLASVGRERVAAAVTFGAVVAVAAACSLSVPGAAFGGPRLVATAYATSAALGAALVVAAFAVRRHAGAFVPLRSAARAVAAGGLLVLVGAQLPTLGKGATILAAVALAVLYFVALALMGELGGEDREALRAVLARRRR